MPPRVGQARGPKEPREKAPRGRSRSSTVAQALADARQPASVTVAAAATTSDSPLGPKDPEADAIWPFQPLALTRKQLARGVSLDKMPPKLAIIASAD